jgi:MoaA/NifB/PqqE/SkfB family radical SAM enzyme
MYSAMKRQNFEQFRQDFEHERPVARALPVQIWLETTTRCNLRCRTCPRRYGSADGRDMSLDVFRRVEEALFPTLRHVELQGWGEPLLAEHFETFYESARRHGVRVSFITNGTLLTPDRLERFVRDDVGLMLSVDGAADATMKELRGVDLGRLDEHIRRYNDLKARAPTSRSNLHLVFVALRRNIAELPALIERAAKDWRAASLLVVHLHTPGLPDDMQAEHLSHDPDRADAIFRESFALARQLGLPLELPPLFNSPAPAPAESAGSVESTVSTSSTASARSTSSTASILSTASTASAAAVTPEAMAAEADKQSYHYCGLGLFRSNNPQSPYPNRCPDPWLKTYIDVDGNVRPCCAYVRVFGNLARQPFPDIWNGPLYQRLRRKIHSRVPPLFCRHCNLIYGLPAGNPRACFARLGMLDRAIVRAQEWKRDYHIWRERGAEKK